MKPSKKTVIAMYSGQLDSIAAVCVYADNYPDHDIILLNVKSGFRIDNDYKYISYNCNKLMSRFSNIVSFKELQNWEDFIELSILPLNFQNSKLKGNVVCIGCIYNIYSQGLKIAQKMRAYQVITGFRARETDFQKHTLLGYIFAEIEKEYAKYGIKHCMPIKSIMDYDELLRITSYYLTDIKQAEYSCLFKQLKNMSTTCEKETADYCQIICKKAFTSIGVSEDSY